MTLRDLSDSIGATLREFGAWLTDLACKVGVNPRGQCYSNDWRDLTLGQTALILFCIYLGFQILYQKAQEMGAEKFRIHLKATLFAVVAFPITAWIELKAADDPRFDIVSQVPFFPFGLLLVFFFILLPVIISGLVYGFFAVRGELALERESKTE